MIYLRAFRAIDEEQSCIDFSIGHKKVLEGFDLGNISTNNIAWAYNPNVYVVMAYDSSSNDVLGGIRIHIAGGEMALPVEDAISHFDQRIHNLVAEYSLNGGTSELCGLWNSRTMAPNIGVTINLVVAGMALCSQLPVTSIFTIVGISTLKIARQMGYRIETGIGNNGEFNYPKSDFIARVLSMNTLELELTFAKFKTQILDLRENPFLERIENLNNGNRVRYIHNLGLNKIGQKKYAI